MHAVIFPLGDDGATLRGQHVLHPVGVRSVGERDDEAVARAEDVQRRPVLLPGLPSLVDNHAEPGSPVDDVLVDPVGHHAVEAGEFLGQHHPLIISTADELFDR